MLVWVYLILNGFAGANLFVPSAKIVEFNSLTTLHPSFYWPGWTPILESLILVFIDTFGVNTIDRTVLVI